MRLAEKLDWKGLRIRKNTRGNISSPSLGFFPVTGIQLKFCNNLFICHQRYITLAISSAFKVTQKKATLSIRIGRDTAW
jgi:hypothetical protein